MHTVRLLLSQIITCGFCLIIPAISLAANPNLSSHPSAYLRSHANDTVQWQLFSKAAFQLAAKQGKPLLLSSGYQACYWCYRMKEDNFTQPAVGNIINQHFIPVIIDRELEMETDQWLQRFMEQQRGFGGWPLTVILTPDGQPVAGFSYTPAEDFNGTLQRFIKDWQDNPTAITERAAQNHQRLQNSQQYTQTQEEGDTRTQTQTQTTKSLPVGTLLQALLQQLGSAADNDYGGFGEREKFPHIPQLSALLELQQLNPDPALRKFMQTTLAAMIGGSLRDHLGGGFFRYSDNRDWGQPHYEKMLYTQALLAPLLIRAGNAWRQPVYAHTGTETLLSMITAFQRADGYFRSSLSAFSEQGQSGGYYLWTEQQLSDALDDKQRSKVLNMLGQEATLTLPFILAQGAEKQVIQNALLTARSEREQSVDDKALTGWNGLALSALAAGSALNPKIRQAGTRLATQLLQLSQQDTIPQLANQQMTNNDSAGTNSAANAASLAAQVYLAKGLADWGWHQQQTDHLSAAAKLLLTIHRRYYKQNGWLYSKDNPLAGTLIRPHLPDSQLPSASALWLQTAYQLIAAGPADDKNKLTATIAEVTAQPNAGLTEQAFYHASYIAQQVKQQIIKAQQAQQQGANTQNENNEK